MWELDRVTGGQDIVLFDGVCAACNFFVQFILDRDPDDHFRFAPLQGDYAAETLLRHGRDPRTIDTVYVVVSPGAADERLLHKSRAAVYILGHLRGPARLLRVLGILPAFLLDPFYDLFARVRYRLFGRYETCRVPTAAERAKFL
jgi:predicted DCC family thiol-disulfide oxidoreductase YuxK